MNLTPCRLRLLATIVAPSTSLMRSLLSEWGRPPYDIALDLVLDPVGVDRRRRAGHAGRSVSVALSSPSRARRRELLAQDLRRLWGGPAGELAVLELGDGGGVHVHHRDLGALLGEAKRASPTHTRCGGGHDPGLASESHHEASRSGMGTDSTTAATGGGPGGSPARIPGRRTRVESAPAVEHGTPAVPPREETPWVSIS